MNLHSYDYLVKVILIGDSGSGKSCLLLRYSEDVFSPNFITTIGIDFKVRTETIGGKRVKLQIWDTAGQERYRTITGAYFRGAHALLIVYSIDNRESFSQVENWLASFKAGGGSAKHIALVGNKCDLEEKRKVSTKEGEELAARHGLRFAETSALSGKGVKESFDGLAAAAVADFAREAERLSGGASLDLGEEPEKKSCCRS